MTTQVKLFYGSPRDVEEEMNVFLREGPVERVMAIETSVAGKSVLITLTYSEIESTSKVVS